MTVRALTDAQVNKLAEDLTGTCSSLHDALARMELTEGGLTRADHDALDEQVFECDVCGWWCEVGEMSEGDDGQVCTECAGSREDEEE